MNGREWMVASSRVPSLFICESLLDGSWVDPLVRCSVGVPQEVTFGQRSKGQRKAKVEI